MGFGSAEYIHHFTEAKKIAFADRAKYYADMDFNKIPVDYLISKEYSELRRSEINSNKAALKVSAAEIENGDTIYLTTADKDGNMVSLIQSNYRMALMYRIYDKMDLSIKKRMTKRAEQFFEKIESF